MRVKEGGEAVRPFRVFPAFSSPHFPAFFRKKLFDTQQRHNAARRAWSESASSARITEEKYVRQIQPRLATITISALASALGVSISYAAGIRKGRHRPLPRHWLTLARLADVALP